MKTIQYIKIKPIGSFSSIQGKQEFTVLEYRENDIICKAKGKRMKYIIQYDNIFNFNKSQYSKQGDFLGNITKVVGGYIPAQSITNYFRNKVYKTEKDAYNYLFNKNFESKRKVIFGCLATSEFYYTKNYLQGKTIAEIRNALKIQYDLSFLTNSQIERIVKKYFKAEVIDYAGQGGYKTKTEIFYSNF